MPERVPPQNLEAEQGVLGSLLLDREVAQRALQVLRPEDFYREAHRTVFLGVCALIDRSEPVDIVTLAEELRREGQLEAVGGVSYLTQLAASVPTAAHAEYYARIVEEKAAARTLIQAATAVVAKAYEGGTEVDALVDEAEQLIFSVSQRRRTAGYRSIKEVLLQTFDHVEKLYGNKRGVTGVATGFRDLDRLTSGLQQSELIVLAARPSQGKSTLGFNIARNVALQEKVPVGIFSLEMSMDQLGLRFLSAEAGVNGQDLRSGFVKESDWQPLGRALARLGQAPIFIDDTPGISLMDLRAKARRMKAEHDIGLLIIDYLQLIQVRSARTENRQQEISEISRSLKALARELKVPVLAMSQLSRAVEQREGQRPQLSDLRESGAIEQDSDVVMFIYFDPKAESRDLAELIIAKQRNGPTGSVKLVFRREILRFGDFEERAEPDR